MLVHVGHVAYQPMRLDETNSVVQTPCLYLYPIKVIPKTTLVTSDDLSRGHIALYFRLCVSNFGLNRDTDIGMAPKCFDGIKMASKWLICNMTYLNHHVTLT